MGSQLVFEALLAPPVVTEARRFGFPFCENVRCAARAILDLQEQLCCEGLSPFATTEGSAQGGNCPPLGSHFPGSPHQRTAIAMRLRPIKAQ